MKTKKKNAFRKLMNDLHLWLGIASSLILFVVCLTGTIYTFKSEIQQMLAPDMYKLTVVKDEVLPIDTMKAFVESTYQGKVQRVSIKHKKNAPYVFSVGFEDKDKKNETVYLNPYTNEVVGAGRGPADEFFMTVFKLHRWLLLDMKIGRPIVGIATIIFVFLSISGLILWFPKKIKGWKSIKPGFKIKFNANWKRINHDLHNTLGFYTLIIVLIMSLTGLCWSFEWYKDGLSSVLGAKVFGGRNEVKPESTLTEGAKTLDLSDVIQRANQTISYEYRTMTVSFPKGDKGSFEVSKNEAARFNETVTDRVFIDQYSGDIIRQDMFSDKSVGEKIASSIRALHFGDIYGMFSKVIYFIVCLIATSLPITGIFIWINKMKKGTSNKV
ncbi:PepSY domain-containing protein [Myroides odoratimimus]|uniref:PepSY-associated TM helix domain-containing protein n=1 Tax=Myroides odoratimimus TaxID=76832 RepID=UPI0002EC04C1|nr:PepSY-associated TM helix domain-containing protein [Myroides odoratimimus]MCA4792823.1 PepSY domain-containing protein [Myroides odoratimimus]MCA4820017.1 PepSY domain-containing protein [Myroides odoratimimus]MCS7472422.1 PepSY domain-containing protein [Myroides odoratimimus]MDM1038567.1 PepSY domain-containing protein [Myroides odoratimimus]MDM1052692.1 PepSY domain-containing protein [Myroides odoratimimus]